MDYVGYVLPKHSLDTAMGLNPSHTECAYGIYFSTIAMKSEPQQPILSSMKYSGVFARGAAMKRRGNSKGFRRIGFCAPHSC
jgi:hypothetical protein